MSNNDFFSERSLQSAVKAELVEQYFKSWARIMKNTAKKYNRKDNRLAFFDLFCGPGRYEDGTKSVPLAILEHAISEPFLCENLVTFFNDQDDKSVGNLEDEIRRIQNIERLKFSPNVSREEIDENYQDQIEQINLAPSLSFLDPWGYRGLSLGLIEAFIKDWGCDCFFFFNYNRINMGLNNSSVMPHMNALFGEGRVATVREVLEQSDFTPAQRGPLIIENIISALEEKAGNQERFVLPFCFRDNNGTRITHYLIFVTKHFKGYHEMKQIMHKASSTHDQGVASFEYCPADERMPRFFEMMAPLDDLRDRLVQKYAGQRMELFDLYKIDSYRTPYLKKHYKEICLKLENDNLVEIHRPSPRSPRNSVANKASISFAQ